MPQVYHYKHLYIVVTGEKDDLVYGRLVNMEAKTVGDAEPVASIANHTPGVEWQEFTGDPAPVLAMLERSP